MSGTSLDGVDIAFCHFEWRRGKWNFSIEKAETKAYAAAQRKKLKGISDLPAEEYAAAHVSYGRFLGGLVSDFLKRNKLKADFVASHGHTIFHQPARHFTSQIGDGAAISAACGLPVICDFRSADVALGGQGAPLVPIGDRFLFSDYTYCLNLGGIANISFEKAGKRIAFDICPVNTILNRLSAEVGKSYDDGGKLAGKGNLIKPLLTRLNAVPFYKKSFPKSLGREDIEKYFFRILDADKSSIADQLATCCEHMAMQVAAITGTSRGKMLVSGGGAYNDFLISRMKHHCKTDLIISTRQITEFKEALIFAFLGVLRWRNEVNCLASVTGASRDSSGGAVYML